MLKLLFAFLLCSFLQSLYAQQSKVDSIVRMLEKIREPKEVDSTRFADVMRQIEKSTLNDTSIAQLERTGDRFNNGMDEYWSYRVKFSILNSLITTDKNKALDYGKYNFEALKKSKTPDAAFIRAAFLIQLRLPYRNSNMLNEGFQYFNEKLKEYKLKNDSIGLADCYYVLGGFYRTTGLLDQGIYNMKKSTSYMDADSKNDKAVSPFANPVGRQNWLNNNGVVGIYYLQKEEYEESIKYTSIPFNEFRSGKLKTAANYSTYLAYANLMLGRLDSVEHYLDLALTDKDNQHAPDNLVLALQVKALYKIKTGAFEQAELILRQCWQLIEENNIQVNARAGTIAPDYYLALLRIQQNKKNEAIELLTKDIARLKNVRLDVLRDYKLMAEIYENTGNTQKAKQAYKSFISLQDSLLADQNKYRSLSFETEQEMNDKELSITKLQSENKISAITKNFTIGIAALILLLGAVVYYRFKSKQKANKILEKTVDNLKSTQSQLIQSEKMASLGELTAGIAHEIQNPLNFMNNFSEVNKELLEEMKDELDKGNIPEAKTIADDVIKNEEKINHHGKRADAIVKGMLQHSRSSSGVKEPTDINALCDEYLRLSYHGLRAKDKSFNATMKTDFDNSIGKINIISQDIGRVILNLLTNAFYAVDEKKKSGVEGYEPAVSISTKKINDKVEIRVSDNGNGIPQQVLDKIFQPFFTTKPTGQGTGLGLSLSYDIITKGHGGELKVETKESEGTTFIIALPV